MYFRKFSWNSQLSKQRYDEITNTVFSETRCIGEIITKMFKYQLLECKHSYAYTHTHTNTIAEID